MVVGREPDREIMGRPQKATESWSFSSSDLAGECVQDVFCRGNEKPEPLGTGCRGHDSHNILALLDHLPFRGTEPQHTM